MTPVENKGCSQDVVIRVSPGQHSLTIEEHKPGGIVANVIKLRISCT
jgi:hypothetical protein